jgi:hypothetical protein
LIGLAETPVFWGALIRKLDIVEQLEMDINYSNLSIILYAGFSGSNEGPVKFLSTRNLLSC